MPETPVIHTRNSVIERVETEFEALEAVIASMSDQDFDRPSFLRFRREDWTIKDAISHVSAWARAMVRSLEGKPRRQPGTALPVNATNAAVYAEWHDRSPAEVVAELRSVRAAAIAALRQRPDEFFSGRARSPRWPGDLTGHVREHRVRHVEEPLRRS